MIFIVVLALRLDSSATTEIATGTTTMTTTTKSMF